MMELISLLKIDRKIVIVAQESDSCIWIVCLTWNGDYLGGSYGTHSTY
jgi:hypothetical protein